MRTRKKGACRTVNFTIDDLEATVRRAVAKRHYPCEEAALCPWDRVEETQWHAIGRCTHVGSVTARNEGWEKMRVTMMEAGIDEATTRLLQGLYKIEEGRFGEPELDCELSTISWRSAADEALRKNMTLLGGAQVWAGEIPGGMHGKLVHDMGMQLRRKGRRTVC